MDRKAILEQAIQTVTNDRQDQYGSPENSFTEISKLWTAYLDKPVSPHDVAMMMCLLKVARIKTGSAKDDNYIDLAGYSACAGEIKRA